MGGGDGGLGAIAAGAGAGAAGRGGGGGAAGRGIIGAGAGLGATGAGAGLGATGAAAGAGAGFGAGATFATAGLAAALRATFLRATAFFAERLTARLRAALFTRLVLRAGAARFAFFDFFAFLAFFAMIVLPIGLAHLSTSCLVAIRRNDWGVATIPTWANRPRAGAGLQASASPAVIAARLPLAPGPQPPKPAIRSDERPVRHYPPRFA